MKNSIISTEWSWITLIETDLFTKSIEESMNFLPVVSLVEKSDKGTDYLGFSRPHFPLRLWVMLLGNRKWDRSKNIYKRIIDKATSFTKFYIKLQQNSHISDLRFS